MLFVTVSEKIQKKFSELGKSYQLFISLAQQLLILWIVLPRKGNWIRFNTFLGKVMEIINKNTFEKSSAPHMTGVPSLGIHTY